jgi:putative transposase
LIQRLAADYPVDLLCQLAGLARSSYYHRRVESADEPQLCQAIRAIAGDWPTYGYRRVTAMLRRDHWTVNAKRVRRLMRQLGLAAAAPKRRVRTTQSQHSWPRFPNAVADLAVERPQQVWVCDITYVQLGAGHVYLAVVMDVFTRRILGWELSRSLDQSLTLAALDRALRHGTPEIHHSDQGVQYAAHDYVERLTSRGVVVSMAAAGCPEENGYAERLMRTIKEEEVALTEYLDFADAYRQLGRFLDDVYNHKRIHSALGYLTQAEFAAHWQTQNEACSDPPAAAPSQARGGRRGRVGAREPNACDL